jgi:beta-glucosidase/6-phospho-beta-glucosidase/beta-galactosidase
VWSGSLLPIELQTQLPVEIRPGHLFRSFLMAGIECTTHKLPSGARLDMLAATRHDEFLAQDYQRLHELGFSTVRSGVRWHRVEADPGRYDFASVLPMLRAASRTGVEVIWDLCHFGWPDDVDIFTPAFVRRFADYTRAFARLFRDESDEALFICPINEPSFFSWAGGDTAHINPYERGRGLELKANLIRAAIEGIEAVWSVLPDARIVNVDPIVNIVPHPARPWQHDEALGYHNAQYQALDMLSGRIWPQLGGEEKYLDLIGVNYYPYNQWIYQGRTILWDDPLYRPFRDILLAVYERYGKPLFISETGTEDDDRADWVSYVCDEAVAALDMGIPLHGMCLYPIFNHPGWLDERHCHNGLWDYADDSGERELFQPVAEVLEACKPSIDAALKRWQPRSGGS